MSDIERVRFRPAYSVSLPEVPIEMMSKYPMKPAIPNSSNEFKIIAHQ